MSVIDPVNSRETSGASVASSGVTSSVMIADPDAAETRHETVADFAAGAGNENDRLSHGTPKGLGTRDGG